MLGNLTFKQRCYCCDRISTYGDVCPKCNYAIPDEEVNWNLLFQHARENVLNISIQQASKDTGISEKEIIKCESMPCITINSHQYRDRLKKLIHAMIH